MAYCYYGGNPYAYALLITACQNLAYGYYAYSYQCGYDFIQLQVCLATLDCGEFPPAMGSPCEDASDTFQTSCGL